MSKSTFEYDEIDHEKENSVNAQKREKRWHSFYQKLLLFKEMNGHVNIPYNYVTNDEDRLPLGKWVANQKKYSNQWECGIRSPLTCEHIALLQELDFFKSNQDIPCDDDSDNSSSFNHKWHVRYLALQDFFHEHGHSDVSRYNQNPLLAELGQWVAHQRYLHTLFEDGKKTSMTRGRIDALERIKFIWHPFDQHFQDRLQELKEFKMKFGHCNVPRKCKEYPSLGSWVSTQRQHYKALLLAKEQHSYQEKQNSIPLNQDRIDALEKIGFEWVSVSKHSPGKIIDVQIESRCSEQITVKVASTWYKRFQELCEYREIYSNCNVPKSYERNKSLAAWVRNQRFQYAKLKQGNKSPMTEERIHALESIGFDWNPKR